MDDAVDQAFLKAVRDGNTSAGEGGSEARASTFAKKGGSRTKLKHTGRPNVPKTFGSRSR